MAIQIHELPTSNTVPSGAYMILKREVLGSQLDYKVDVDTVLSPFINRNTEVGTGIGDLVKLIDIGGNPGFPAVDGSQLTNINVGRASDTVYGITRLSDAIDSTLNATNDETAATPLAVRNMGLTKLSLTGGDLSGSITFDNNVALRSRDSSNTPIDIIKLDAVDDLFIGSSVVENITLTGRDKLKVQDGTAAEKLSLDITTGDVTTTGAVSIPETKALNLGGTPVKYTTGNLQIGETGNSPANIDLQVSNKVRIKNTTGTSVFEFEPNSGNVYGIGASSINFTPVGTISASNVQDAIEELNEEMGSLAGTAEVKYERIVATEGQIVLSLTNPYTPSTNGVAVYVNGVRLTTNEYTETDGTTITLSTGLTAGDNVDIYTKQALVTSRVAVRYEKQLGSQAVNKVFTLVNMHYHLGVNNLNVYCNGQKLVLGNDYTETDVDKITLTFDPLASDIFEFYSSVDVTNSTTDTSAITHTDNGTDYNLATYLNDPTPTTVTAGDKARILPSERDSFVVSRDLEGLTDAHAFADQTVIDNVTDSGTYGTFDSTTEVRGNHSHNHLYAFQDRNQYNGTGSMVEQNGFYSSPVINNTGTVSQRNGVMVKDVTGTGTPTINTGIRIKELSGGTNNFSIVSEGQVSGYHGGSFSFGFPTSSPTANEGLAYVGISTEGVSQTGIKSRGGASSEATFQYSAFEAIPALSPGSYTTQETHGLVVRDASVGVGASLTNAYGISIDDQTAGDNNYGIQSTVTAGTDKWNIYLDGNANNWISGNTRYGIDTITPPTAQAHYSAGTTSAGSAPIKLTQGDNMTVPENGAFEFDGTNLYFTVGGVRRTVSLV